MHLLWILVVYDLILFPFGIPRMILKFILLVAERLSNTEDNVLPRGKILNHTRRKKTRYVRKINLPTYVREGGGSDSSECEEETKVDSHHNDSESQGSCDCVEEPEEPEEPEKPEEPEEPEEDGENKVCVGATQPCNTD